MYIKKIILLIIITTVLYIITQHIVKKYSIETFSNTVFAPYSETCQKKLLDDATYYKYSVNDLNNVYSLTSKNDSINIYYKSLSDSLGNININKNIVDPINNINKTIDNSILIQDNSNTFVNSKICKNKNIFINKDINGINIYNFQKIDSLMTDIVPSGTADNSVELSNAFFNLVFLNLITNSKNYIKIFKDLSENIDKSSYEIFTKVENIILKKINSLKELKYNTINEYNIFHIVKQYINSFLKDSELNLYTINFDLLIHRLKKQNAKHINIIINYNDDTKIMDIVQMKVIGIVVEYDLNITENNIINIYNESDYSLLKMSDIEIDKYLENHKNNVTINT